MSMILINLILFNKTTALQALEVMEWTSKATDIVWVSWNLAEFSP